MKTGDPKLPALIIALIIFLCGSHSAFALAPHESSHDIISPPVPHGALHVRIEQILVRLEARTAAREAEAARLGFTLPSSRKTTQEPHPESPATAETGISRGEAPSLEETHREALRAGLPPADPPPLRLRSEDPDEPGPAPRQPAPPSGSARDGQAGSHSETSQPNPAPKEGLPGDATEPKSGTFRDTPPSPPPGHLPGGPAIQSDAAPSSGVLETDQNTDKFLREAAFSDLYRKVSRSKARRAAEAARLKVTLPSNGGSVGHVSQVYPKLSQTIAELIARAPAESPVNYGLYPC